MSKYWYLICVSLAFSAPAFAQEASEEARVEEQPSETDEQARVLYLRGDRLYNEGRYEEATAAFQESYDMSGRPGLLFNLANAYERLGRLEEALQALQRFAPDAPEHQQATVNTRIANIEERLRAEDAERRAREEATDEANVTQTTAPTPQATESAGWSSKPLGIALLTIGAAAAGGGLAAALLARSSRGDIDDACMGGLCPASASDDIDAEKRRALAADILLFGGGALVVGGLIAIIAGRSSDDDRAHLEVTPTLGGMSGSLTGSF